MAYFHCLIGGGSSGGGYELTVTCDADFAGTTITCTDGVTTLTQTCPSASPYEVVFAIPNGGEWTISGIISGQTYSASVDIPDSLELHSVPEGSTVLPTDDIQTWLACAGITDKAYTTLNEVLADSTTLLALISDNNASDYLVRSTTWASGLTADSTAMTDIGANNYCANTLLSDSTWAEAICNSIYFESVLNVKVPTMTSDTTPSGECFGSSLWDANNTQYYKAFDGNTSDGWLSDDQINAYVGYKFTSQIKVVKASITNNPYDYNNYIRLKNYKIQGSNDNFVSDVHDLATDIYPNQTVAKENVFSNNAKYQYYRYFINDSHDGYIGAKDIQFYGREDV
jgi:hypothetical protein